MKRNNWVFIFLFISFPLFATEEIKEERLNALMELDIEELGEVEVKLDDVFDIFDGLVKSRKVSVASGVEQETTVAPAVTTLITAQDIEATGARTLDEALNMVPGLHVGKRGAGYGYIYTMRGIHTNPSPEVLILLNNAPFKAMEDGRSPLNLLPTSIIQRIEVIRGPGSALYGADAFAGVINIITKNAHNLQGTEIGARAGSFKSTNAWVSHSEKHQDIDFSVIIDKSDSDGHHALIEEDAQTQFDRKFGTQASLAPNSLNTKKDISVLQLDAGVGKHWRWRANFQQGRDMGIGLGVAQALDPKGNFDFKTGHSDLNYHNATFAPHWEVNAQLSYQFQQGTGKYSLYPKGAFGGLFHDGFLWNTDIKEQQIRLDTNALYRGWKNHLVRIGTGWHESKINGVSEQRNWGVNLISGMPYPLSNLTDFSNSKEVHLPLSTRKNFFSYLQDTWTFDPAWELTTGIRYDHFSDFGATTNPRIALVWKTTPSLTSKLLYGSAFRAPTTQELYLNSPLLGIGNSYLKPETIDTLELAWDWLMSRELHFALNLFHYRIKDKIGFPNGQYQWANYGKWKGQGLEFETRWKISTHSALLFNYAYQNGKDETNHAIADALKQSAYLRFDWMFSPNWFLDITNRWIADRPRAINDIRSPMKDYVLTDVILRYKGLKNNWNIAIGVRNLFNEDAREPTTVNIGVTNDLPLPRRELFGEIRYMF